MALMDRLRGRPTPEQVVRDHSQGVACQLRRIFGPRADIDDVFQAVFVEVLRSLPAFKGRSKLKTWIHRITLNVAYQEMRMQYREKAVRTGDDLETVMADVPCEEDDIARSESLALLYAGLETLDPKKRMAVVLHDVEGYTLKEVAEMLGRPLQTVASQVKTGRGLLARYLADADGEALRVVSGREVSAS